jgi:tRNA threonylcarbamoyladenosine biosynthesis protein TsaB
MIKLLIDTSGKEMGIGLFENKKCLYEEYKDADKAYNKKIMLLIDETLKQAQIDVDNVDLFGATLGPGSFTGIRVGISVMKALSRVLDKKFYGVPIPYIMAKSAGISDEIVVLLDAGRKEFYFTRYNFNREKKKVNYELFDKNETINSIKKDDAIVFLQNDVVADDFVVNNFKNNKIVSLLHVDMKTFNDIIDADNITEKNGNYLFPVYVRRPDAEKKIRNGKT